LLSLGADVYTASRRDPQLPSAHHLPLDLSDPDSIRSAASAIDVSVDALFNCAGAVPMIESTDLLKINFLGTRLFTELVLEKMSSGAAIVNTSSDAGYAWRKSLPLLLSFLRNSSFESGLEWYAAHEEAAGHAYTFGKDAINVWTMQQAQTLIKRGIRINTVSPGAVQTPMLEAIEEVYSSASIAPVEEPIGRRSAASEQVGPLLFLNSDSASYVNGADLAVDGGFWARGNLAKEYWN
jgi:NAD(P)-dependent dehydrogenase (short-subunit alcohol dehydrogenase family)